MGIAKGCLKAFLELKKTEEFAGKKILQLGRQHTFLSYDEIREIAKSFPVSINEAVPPSLSFNQDLKKQGFVDDVTVFKMLGFETVHSLDSSDYEKATYIHDLNVPVPEHLHEKYDVILDGGTLEHVFHLPNCLANIHKMLKTSGLVIHSSVSHNHVDHGFYMFSPSLFYEYYKANKYEIVRSRFFEYSTNHVSKPWKIYEYTPGCLEELSFGGFGKEMLLIWLVAKKTSVSSYNMIPQQNFSLEKDEEKRVFSKKKENKIKNFLKRFKFLKAIKRVVVKPKKPVIIDRY